MQLKPGDVLNGDFWPEPVRVLTVQVSGPRVKIEAVGLRTQQFFPRILSPDDLDRVRVSGDTGRDFTGRAEVFFLAVEGHRVRYAYQFDPLYAVNVSQVDPLPHQIEAVYHYILKNPRLRFLLADDPGAGKTIMTGLLIKELKYRGLVQRTLIVVPGHLKDQWLREMKERFSETFTVVDRGVMNATWGRNVWQEQPLVITSMDFAKQEDVTATLAETQWDSKESSTRRKSVPKVFMKPLRLGSERSWVEDIGQNFTIRVLARDTPVEHTVEFRAVHKWLEQPGRSPREITARARVREILALK